MLKYINIIIVILTCLSILNDNESKSNRNNLLFCQERQYEIDDVFFICMSSIINQIGLLEL